MDADLWLPRLQICLSVDLIPQPMHAVIFPSLSLATFLSPFLSSPFLNIFSTSSSQSEKKIVYQTSHLFIVLTVYVCASVFCYHKVHLVLWAYFKCSTPTPKDLFEENERCLQNVWSKPGIVAKGLQLMLIRCPNASHGAYDCLVSKQIVYF